MAHFTAGHALGWGFYWIAVEEGAGNHRAAYISMALGKERVGAKWHDGFTDTETGLPLEFGIWTASQNVSIVGDGRFALTLAGYPA